MHGLELQIEAVRQIRGESTSQVPGARRLAWSISGPMVTPVSSMILRHARRRCERRDRTTCPRACRARCRSPTGSTRRTGRARAAASCWSSAAAPAARWQWGPEWICHRCLSFDIELGSACGPRGRIYSWERAWHPVHPALQGPRPVHRGAGRAARGRRRPHDRQPRSAIRAQAVQIGAPVEAVFEPHDDASRRSRSCSGGVTRMSHDRHRRSTSPTSGGSRRPGTPAGRAPRARAIRNKYFIVSADCHANEPADLWAERIDAKYRDRLPRVDHRRQRRAVARVRGPPAATGCASTTLEGEDRLRQQAGADPARAPARPWTATASTPR